MGISGWIRRSRKGLSAGFSLIELSLALVVISSVAVVLITKYTTGYQNRLQIKAVQDLKTVKKALEAYVVAHKYYPCPADPTLLRTDTFFGLGERDVDGNCNNLNLQQAIFDDNTRFTNYYQSPGNAVIANDVIMGTIPCKDLGLADDCLFDPQGNRYSYAVIPELARAGTKGADPSTTYDTACDNYMDAATLQALLHLRIIKYFDGVSNIASADQYPNDPADYALVYFGPDGMGAYVNDGSGRITSEAIAGGNYAGDNQYQEINHNLHAEAGPFDEYFFMPTDPLDSSVTFGDIVVFGKSEELRRTFCVRCPDCGPYTGDMNIEAVQCPPTTGSACTTSAVVCAAALAAGKCHP